MPATQAASSPAPRFVGPRFLALAAGTVLLGLAGPAPADPGASGGIVWETPPGMAGVDAYRLDFLGASGLAPMAAPLAPTPPEDAGSVVPAPFETTAGPEAPSAEAPAIRPVATTPLGGIDRPAGRRGGYSLSDAVRDAGWRKATADRLRRIDPNRPTF